MAAAASSTRRLWRYNYQILTGTGYWIVVLPVAASQVVTLWMMALSTDFSQALATYIAEMMTPILGAFLVAHSLAPEYRSGIGAVLACKPVSLHRVVTMRAGLAMLAAVLLTYVTLLVCNLGLAPIDIWSPLAASLPSLWFLSLFALTFATLFRSALGGFAVAAALWTLDLTVGYMIHPLLSLQGLHARIDNDPLAKLWPWSKLALFLIGCVLLWLHGRLIHRVCRPPERRDILRMVVPAVVLLLVYCASGAATMIAYAYVNRGHLDQADSIWLRRQLKNYGPVPVAGLFGSAFSAYVAQPPQRPGISQKEFRMQQLRQALRRSPGSIWADGMQYALAMENETLDLTESVRNYSAVVDRYPKSPFATKALARIIALDEEGASAEDQLRAARRLLSDYPGAPEMEQAANSMVRFAELVEPAEMERAALAAAEAGPRYRRPFWLVEAAKLQVARGDTAAARGNAQQAIEAATHLRQEDQKTPMGASFIARYRSDIDKSLEEAKRLLSQTGG